MGCLDMSILSDRIDSLCKEKGITGYRLCKDIGISPNIMTELRNGRRNGVSAKTADKIASYFEVSVGYLLGTETEKAPTPAGEHEISDEAIKFALFGGEGEITDAMYEEVKQFARMVRLREEAEKKKEQT